jgi:hypothetical protein
MQLKMGGAAIALFWLSVATAAAQSATLQSFPLNDLSAFRPQAGNWMIVGDVSMDPNVDVHTPPPAANVPAKKGKKQQSTPATSSGPVVFQAGTGILLNMNDDKTKDHLITTLEHGDIDLELEVMLPKGSNSGIYLQGRYEVQLFDSWGEKNPKFSDIGGIYRNWEREPGKIYMGKAPLSNPCKAPGLWQKMRISFKAPRFDAAGNKIANARFVYVDLNGVRIHDNVEVPLPTGGPIENNERATGPLMIQGDHGPVAFRNIRYQITSDLRVEIRDVSFKAYVGRFKETSEFLNLTPAKTGSSGNELTCEVLDTEDEYGITYQGTLQVFKDDTYQFWLAYTGGAVLQVNGQTLIDFQRPDAWELDEGKIDLKAGTYPFVIHNFKAASWMPPRLGFAVQTATSLRVDLHDYNSYPPDDNPVSPIFIQAGAKPRLLRAFVDFKGDYRQRIAHSIGVGDPSGVNYVYDLDAGNVACVWRGDFVDATPMWHDRGDGSFRPLGAPQFTYLAQSLAFLTNATTDAFPSPGAEPSFRSRGYRIDEATGRPVFVYQYQGLEVEEQVMPHMDRAIQRSIAIKNREGKTGLFIKLGEGKRIDKMPDGSFAVDDRQYYIKTNLNVVVREINGIRELIAPVETNQVQYTIIW